MRLITMRHIPLSRCLSYTAITTGFDNWNPPVIVERGSNAHQLYSQITFRFYDIFFGIVMVFDAENGSVG